MSLELFDAILLRPLVHVYANLFSAMPERFGVGFRLIAFSVVVNLLLLPLYLQMEKGTRELRALRGRVARDVERMRRHFRGRERYFYVRAVHRQHGYHPIVALSGSADLFIQILVFITVYRYLSGLGALEGASFGPIADLARQDALLGGLNVLPIAMTAFNLASVFAYEDERGKRVQSLALATLFLLLLYSRPSGLVLYWTTNNLFSLLRNVIGRRLVPRLATRWKQPWVAIAQQE